MESSRYRLGDSHCACEVSLMKIVQFFTVLAHLSLSLIHILETDLQGRMRRWWLYGIIVLITECHMSKGRPVAGTKLTASYAVIFINPSVDHSYWRPRVEI